MSVNKFTKGLSAEEKAEIQEKFIEVNHKFYCNNQYWCSKYFT